MTTSQTFVIIYNPKSTGDSKRMAEDFQEELRQKLPNSRAELKPTKHAGHAEDLARAAANKKNHIVISVSGDGGFHEVVNGVLTSNNPQTPCAVLPGGNANDFHNNISERPLIEAILAGATKPIDVLKINYGTTTRYAHSYVGLGISPLVAIELNKHELSRLRETWLTVKTFRNIHPTRIKVNGKLRAYDSLVFSNAPKMAKYLKISEDIEPDDSTFALVAWRHRHTVVLILKAFLSFIRPPGSVQLRTMQLETVAKTPMQIDGEIYDIPANTIIDISVEPQILTTYA